MSKLPLCTVLILAGAPALAGPDHPLYFEAKKAYADADCATALPMLKRYMRIDAAYLAAHDSDAKEIAEAIKYCARKIEPSARQAVKPDDFVVRRRETFNAKGAEKPDWYLSGTAQHGSASEDARAKEKRSPADREGLVGRRADANSIRALERPKSSLSKEGALEFKSK